MRATLAGTRAILLAPLAPARVLSVAWSEWRLAASRGAQLSMATSSLFLILAKVAALGIGFVCWLVAARLFPETEVGLASTTVSATNLVALLAILGIGWSVIGQFVAQARPDDLLDSAISLVGIASALASGVFLAVAAFALGNLRVLAVDPRFAVCFVLFGVSGTVGLLLDQISAVMRRGDQAMTRNVVRGLVTLAVIPGALLVAPSDRSLALVGAWTAGSVVMIAIGVRQLGRQPLRYVFRPRIRLAFARPLVAQGIPNQILNLAQRLPGTVLPVLVTELISPADSAVWYGAWMMASVVFFIPIQIGTTLYAELSYQGARIRRLAGQAMRLSLGLGALTAIIGAVAVGYALFLLGPGYASAGTMPFRIVVLAVVPMTVMEVYCAVCRGTRRMGEAIATALLSAVVSLAATAMVAAQYGLAGIAGAWLAVQGVTGLWAGLRLAWLLRGADSADAEDQPTSQ
jgi:O-antigen/teichoic acid export membrane protein